MRRGGEGVKSLIFCGRHKWMAPKSVSDPVLCLFFYCVYEGSSSPIASNTSSFVLCSVQLTCYTLRDMNYYYAIKHAQHLPYLA